MLCARQSLRIIMLLVGEHLGGGFVHHFDQRLRDKEQGLKIRVGRWTVPGEPIAILVDFNPYFEKKNEIYGWLWENYGVDSLHAYGDYDEASMFSYAAALVVESFYNHYLSLKDKVIYHANEWMCGLGALYINNKLPQIGRFGPRGLLERYHAASGRR